MDDDELVEICTASGRILGEATSPGTALTALAVAEAARDGGVDVVSRREARARLEARFRREPFRISCARFVEMRDMLAPFQRTLAGDTETFTHAEVIAESIVPFFARVGDRHFEMAESIGLSHAAILARVMASSAWHGGVEAPDNSFDPTQREATRFAR